MPYRRPYRSRRPFKSRRRFSRRPSYGSSAMNLAQGAMKGVKFLKSILNVERKTLDTSGTGVTVSDSGSVVWLSTVTTGTAYNQRTGSVVKAVQLSMRGNIVFNSSASATQFRCIVFYNKGLNQGATPAVTDILQNTTGNAGPISPYNVDNVGDFKVLSDKVYLLDDVNNRQKNFSMFARLGHHLRWDTSGDAIADTEQGHIFMLLVSDEATNTPTLSYTARLRFIDN